MSAVPSDRLTLMASSSHGAHYVVRCIALAEALRQSDPSLDHFDIQVTFVPAPDPATLLAALRGTLSLRRRNRRFGSAVSSDLGAPAPQGRSPDPVLSSRAALVDKINKIFLHPQEGAVAKQMIYSDQQYFFTTSNARSAYRRFVGGEPVRISERIAIGTIDLSLESLLKSLAIALFYTVRHLAVILSERLRRRQTWKVTCVLLRQRGTLLGDLVVSELLSIDPSAGGQLRISLRLAKVLLRAAWATEYYRALPVAGCTLCTAPEPTYLAWLLPRTLSQNGVPILAPRMHVHGAAQPELEPAGSTLPKFREELIAPAQTSDTRSDSSQRARRDELAQWMDERVRDRNALIPHFSRQPSESARIQLAALRARTLDRLFVVFLHDFRDAQLFFGVNEFVDLYSWAEAAIAACTQYPAAHTLVKQHPADMTSLDATNVAALARLKSRFAGQSVEFLDGSTVLHDVLDATTAKDLVGITHHGTVAEELAWLNVPVIASRTGPWGKHYTFCSLWETRTQMETLISRPASELRGDVSREVLLDYLAVRRIQRPAAPHDAVEELLPNAPRGYNDHAAHWLLEELSRNADPEVLMRRAALWSRRIEVDFESLTG